MFVPILRLTAVLSVRQNDASKSPDNNIEVKSKLTLGIEMGQYCDASMYQNT